MIKLGLERGRIHGRGVQKIGKHVGLGHGHGRGHDMKLCEVVKG